LIPQHADNALHFSGVTMAIINLVPKVRGSAGTILHSQRAEFGEQSRRLHDDSIVRASTIRAKAANTRRAGSRAMQIAGIGVAGAGLSTIGSLLN
jgi:hypothetical protein